MKRGLWVVGTGAGPCDFNARLVCRSRPQRAVPRPERHATGPSEAELTISRLRLCNLSAVRRTHLHRQRA